MDDITALKNLRMGPLEYARLWYDDKVQGFIATAKELIADGITDDTKIAHELHEWLSAPDSFLNWVNGEEEAVEIAEAILRTSENASIAGDHLGTEWDEEDDSTRPFYAAHAFIADVMVALNRDPGPYGTDFQDPA